MPDATSFGIVGSGGRGRRHLKELYKLRDMPYLHGRHSKDVEGIHLRQNSHDIYHEHASDVPEWAEDTSDIVPRIDGICDPSAESRRRAQSICRDRGDDPDTYADLDAFLDGNDYDAVIVASPNHTHADVALRLLEREIDTFCEKPLATTLPDHDAIIEANRRSESLFYVGFNARHSPAVTRLRELIADGEIGDLGAITIEETRHPFPLGHYYTQEESGGSLLEKDCHDFDKMNMIVDGDPVRVMGIGGQHVFDEDTDVLDNASVLVEYDNGVNATLELCLYAPFRQPGGRVYSIRGSEGIIRNAPGDAQWELFTRHRRETYDVTTGGDDAGHGGADLLMWRDFFRALRGETEPPASPLDAKKASAVALAAERAIADGEIVRIDDDYNLV